MGGTVRTIGPECKGCKGISWSYGTGMANVDRKWQSFRDSVSWKLCRQRFERIDRGT